MLAQHARSEARFDDTGDLVVLEDQDRERWDRAAVVEAGRILESAMRRRSVGPYQLQAAIAALHSEAPTFADTDWPQIAALYGVLAEIDPSPVIALNRAVVIGFADGPEAGLTSLATVEATHLPQPHLLHSATAELLVRAGMCEAATDEFDKALGLVTSDAERRHLERRRRATSG